MKRAHDYTRDESGGVLNKKPQTDSPFAVADRYLEEKIGGNGDGGDRTVIESVRESDLVLTVAQWFPEFHRLHMTAVHDTRDFDYGRVRQNRPDLYRQIKAIEDQIDSLYDTRLSVVMELMGRWRELIERACAKDEKTRWMFSLPNTANETA
jgi:hypothetical protein